ncbi:uncharacterized protein LOC143211034 isoform X1 [Lasioglossum baleicum]|uniref:uncharacterized protein LOC143211034 isoform X1 n=1 Tax=Lasioglossum baleicum TaxID=434251 RepID=UPI003FCD2DEB
MDVKRQDSLRKNKKRKVHQIKEESKQSWSNTDKRTLLEALKKYGDENILAISEMLPHISPVNIKLKISEYSDLASISQENELDKWLNYGIYEPGDSLIPEALLFISLFEGQPSPVDADGYDFRAIYNFLYHLCLEESPSDLSENDLSLLCSSLSNIEDRVWPNQKKDILAHAGRANSKMNIKKVYQGKTTHSL